METKIMVPSRVNMWERYISEGILEKPLHEETPEEYVHRFHGGLINAYIDRQQHGASWSKGELERSACRNFINTKDAPAALIELLELLEFLQHNENKKFSSEKQEAVLSMVSEYVDSKYRGESLGSDQDASQFFANMAKNKSHQLTRKFFPEDESGKVGEGYTEMIFGFPKIFTEIPEVKAYLEKFLNNKTIFLFGGGNSIQDIMASTTISPKEIINFDPFSQQDPVNDNSLGIYSRVDLSAADPKIIQLVNNGEVPKADELWATFSVPYYLVEPKEISENINITKVCLSENGNARIYPLQLQRSDLPQDSSRSNCSPFQARKDILMEALSELAHDPNFNISFFEGCLKIHKIKDLTSMS